jgi:hypothetical protein
MPARTDRRMPGRPTPALIAATTAASRTAHSLGQLEPAPKQPYCASSLSLLLSLVFVPSTHCSPPPPPCSRPCPRCPSAPLPLRPPLCARSTGRICSRSPSVSAAHSLPKFTAERERPGRGAAASQLRRPLGLRLQVGGLALSSHRTLAALSSSRSAGLSRERDPRRWRKEERVGSLREPSWSRLQRGPRGGAGVGPKRGAGATSLRGLRAGLRHIPARRKAEFPPLHPALWTNVLLRKKERKDRWGFLRYY